MKNLLSPLTDHEIDVLDRFMLERLNVADDSESQDEGVLDISELDGFFTALVSGPVTAPPSLWLPVVWGEHQPEWDSEQEFEAIISLMIRHMNAIAATLMEQSEDFVPIFLEREIGGKVFTIVDEWCEGYLRGLSVSADQWASGGPELDSLLAPVLAFTSATNWAGHEVSDPEVEGLQAAIILNVREIHAFWLARREEFNTLLQPTRRSGQRIGRNDPCPCGSGK